MKDCPCRGGFCRLRLPGSPPAAAATPGANGKKKGTLSKRERRLEQSRQRERGVRVLRWVLTEDEYGSLEEAGDLLRLRVRAAGDDDRECGRWIDGRAVELAGREHRQDLARLAFAEFQSSSEGGGDAGRCSSSAAAGGDEPVVVAEPEGRSGPAPGDVVVCGNCYYVYNLLEQSRVLLAALREEESGADDVDEIAVAVDDQVDDRDEQPSAGDESLERLESVPSSPPNKSSSAGPNSSQWDSAKSMSSKSFHGPISPHEPSERAKRKKRERQQVEENSNIRILLAHRDEASNKLVKRLLEKRGYKVDCALHGADFAMLVEKHEYQILLLNEELGGKEASSIGTHIRRKEAAHGVRVKMRILVIVQRILTINYHPYEDADVDGFLPLPLEGSKLIPTVEKVVAQYRESVRLDQERIRADDRARRSEQKRLDQENAVVAEQPAVKTKETPKKRAKPKRSHLDLMKEKLKKKEPTAREFIFRYDDATSFPYAILENDEAAGRSSATTDRPPWCNLVVCQDVFDTYEKFKIFFLPIVSRYAGMKILLWNYPGQAFTSFSCHVTLNNKYHADCLARLLEGMEDHERFHEQRYFILAHGSGASIATHFAAAQQPASLKGIVLVNGLSHVDSHYASVFHDCRNVFSCSPESRPDLPVYFYARYLFSSSYLSKTTSSLALNIYTAVHNPITLEGRKRLCQGALDHVDTRPMLKDIGAPIVAIHGENGSLVRAFHSQEFLVGRRSCSTIPQALRGGNRTAIVLMKGGHELFQEKRYYISLLVEQILTGFHDKVRTVHQLGPAAAERGKLTSPEVVDNGTVTIKEVEEPPLEKEKVPRDGTAERSTTWDRYQDEIMATDPQENQPSGALKQSREPTTVVKKGFDPNEFPEVKEYMAWRIKRHKQRLAALDRSARVIQCALRCFMAKTMMGRIRKQLSATILQRRARGMFGRAVYRVKKKELWAVLLVQRAIRGHSGRCVSYSRRMERRAQMNVARMVRGIAARRRFQAVIRKREHSATKIQSIWRMHASVVLKKYHRRRRDEAVRIQKLQRGVIGRKLAALERDKYIFSRSHNAGIELGRQMLTEHKLHATKLQSELTLLNQEKDKMEKQIEFHLKEVSNFERTVTDLERRMHALSKVDSRPVGVLVTTSDEARLREEKRRMDVEFSETLAKISDRKAKLVKLEQTFEELLRDRREKFGQLKALESKLAVLLDAQDTALDEIRRKQEQRIESVMSASSSAHQPTGRALSRRQSQEVQPTHQQVRSHGPLDNTTSSQQQLLGPSERDKRQAAQLIDSTETMMKFGFMSMSLTYFSSLNMMRAMQKVAVEPNPGSPMRQPPPNAQVPLALSTTSDAAVRVESWSVNDVSRWLTSISLSQYHSSFKEGAVDGSFLCELTDDDLRNTLGVEHRLHRKKILFSIRCLRNVAESQAMHTVSPLALVHQPQQHRLGTPSEKSVSFPSPANNEAGGANADLGSSYSPNESTRGLSAPQRKPNNSILDMLTPTLDKKPARPLPRLDQLKAMVRHQKLGDLREALESVPDVPFNPKHIRVQYAHDIGTAYTDEYDQEPFNTNRVDDHGNTLLHIAAQTGNIRIGKLLTSKGVNPNHQNRQGQTPGHFAVAYHFFKMASWLMDERGAGADDTIVNNYGLGVYDGLEP